VDIRVELTGVVAVLVQNKRMADPLDSATQRLNELVRGKAAKDRTEEDIIAIAHAEFDGSIYWDPALGPYAPTEWLEASLKKGAHMAKKNSGPTLQRALLFTDDKVALEYDGPRKMDELWKDENYRFTTLVRNPSSGARVLRTRPMFREWSLTADAHLDTALVELPTLIKAGTMAGLYIGIGSWRPKYGRFTFNAYEIKDGH
jgi:hypothetical protein